MDFDQMLDAWKGQDGEDRGAHFGLNRDALRQALELEEAKVRRDLRTRRRGLWAVWIFGAGMAVWAAFWIAITITNGWPALYVVTSLLSIGLFALGIGLLWRSRGPRPEPQRDFANTLQEEVRRSLAVVEHRLAVTRNWFLVMLGTGAIVAAALLFSWTTIASQDIDDGGLGSGWLIAIVLVFLITRGFRRERAAIREATPKLELRRRRLRKLLDTLDAGE